MAVSFLLERHLLGRVIGVLSRFGGSAEMKWSLTGSCFFSSCAIWLVTSGDFNHVT